jgi:hypothetical protein
MGHALPARKLLNATVDAPVQSELQ